MQCVMLLQEAVLLRDRTGSTHRVAFGADGATCTCSDLSCAHIGHLCTLAEEASVSSGVEVIRREMEQSAEAFRPPALTGCEECCICYEALSADGEPVCCPACKHMFHLACMVDWNHTSRGNTCPTCRSHCWKDCSFLLGLTGPR